MLNIIVHKRVLLNFDVEAVAQQTLPLGCASDISKPFVHFTYVFCSNGGESVEGVIENNMFENILDSAMDRKYNCNLFIIHTTHTVYVNSSSLLIYTKTHGISRLLIQHSALKFLPLPLLINTRS